MWSVTTCVPSGYPNIVIHTVRGGTHVCSVHWMWDHYISDRTYVLDMWSHVQYVSPITILDPTRTVRTVVSDVQYVSGWWDYIVPPGLRTHMWPHVQYVQSYHYIYPTRTYEHTSLTTCPVRTVLSLYYIPPSTYETHMWPHVYVQSYHYIRSHHPLTKHT